jgi:hypothetical protein
MLFSYFGWENIHWWLRAIFVPVNPFLEYLFFSFEDACTKVTAKHSGAKNKFYTIPAIIR